MTARTLLSAVSVFLIASGVLGFVFPRAIVLSHPTSGRRLFRSGLTEYLTPRHERAYSEITILLGAMIGGATLVGSLASVPARDRRIARAIERVQPELLRRYGSMNDCSQPQIVLTARELKIPERLHPYLLAAFMGRDALALLEQQMPGVDRKEVEARTERIFSELPTEFITADHFHVSWAD